MDPAAAAAAVITQVQRDEEALATFPPPPPAVATKGPKPRKGGLLHSLLCCWRRRTGSGRLRGSGVGGNDQTDHAEQGAGHNHQGQTGLLTSNIANTPVQQGQHDGSNKLSLLPPLGAWDEGKICLVIDLDETLVHSSFKPVSNPDFVVPVEIEGSVHQVYVLKRPYVDEFLERVGALYECVLFTASLSKYADPVADLLDKSNVFRSRLFRESCAFYRGNYVKDLNRLGREVHRVVIIDNSPASYMFHPDNAVPVGSWFDDMSDTELRDLIPFFERLARAPPQDVYNLLRQLPHTMALPAVPTTTTTATTATTATTTSSPAISTAAASATTTATSAMTTTTTVSSTTTTTTTLQSKAAVTNNGQATPTAQRS